MQIVVKVNIVNKLSFGEYIVNSCSLFYLVGLLFFILKKEAHFYVFGVFVKYLEYHMFNQVVAFAFMSFAISWLTDFENLTI